MRRRARLAAAAVVAAAVLLTSCSGGLSETGEPLTVAQSEELAQARFRLSTAGEFVVRVSVGDDDDTERLAATLTVDGTDHVAWGALDRGPEGIAVSTPLVLSADGYALQQADGWAPSPWDGGAVSTLSLVLQLTADRPENAQLLRQSDATYLGTEDGQDVFRLPTQEGDGGGVTRLWLADGELTRLDTGGEDLSIVVDRDAEPVERPAELAQVLGLDDE